jgi:hypothetical protein
MYVVAKLTASERYSSACMRGSGVATVHARGDTWYCLLHSENTLCSRSSLTALML